METRLQGSNSRAGSAVWAVNHADAGSGLARSAESSVKADLSWVSVYPPAPAEHGAGDGQPVAETWAGSLKGSRYPCATQPPGARTPPFCALDHVS